MQTPLIPKEISKDEILEILAVVPNLREVTFSEPLQSQNYSRYAILEFETSEDCNISSHILENVEIKGIKLLS